MLDNEQDKYFYDFGDTEPTDELPPAIEELSQRIKARKEKILQQRENAKKTKLLREQMKKNKDITD